VRGKINPAAAEEEMLAYVSNFLQTSFRTCLNPRISSHSLGWRAAGLLLVGLILNCATASAATAPAPSATAKRVAANYGQIPLRFEPNKGQTDPSVRFLSRGSGYSLFLTTDEVVLNLERQHAPAATTAQKPAPAPVDTLRMKLVGANSTADVTGLEPQSSVVSYLIGNDPKKWHTGIATFGKVNFAQVYPGVDLVFYGNQRQLEYDFVVAPGADATHIAWQIDGAKATIDADGNLVLSAANGPAGFKKPVLYQMDGGKKVAVNGAFTVAGDRIGFQLGSYDHNKALIIDPVLTYATYLGGSGVDSIGGIQVLANSGLGANNALQAIGFDSQGSAYVVVTAQSTDFPVLASTVKAPTKAQTGISSVIVSKFSPDGSSLVYSTLLGGTNQDSAVGIAVDSNGEAFVVGTSSSQDFPITSGAYQTVCAPGVNDDWTGYTHIYTERATCSLWGNSSAFVAKLNAAGTGLVYSTFLGGNGSTDAQAIAVDSAGRAYVGGTNNNVGCILNTNTNPFTPIAYTCFPTTSGAVVSGQEPDDGHAPQGFVSVLDAAGANLLYSSLFSSLNPLCVWNGPNYDCVNQTTYVNGVAVDSSGNFYIVGDTNAMGLPTTEGVFQPKPGPASSGNPLMTSAVRGFIAKFNPVTATGGSSLAYATYLGGNTPDMIGDEAVGAGDSVASITTDAEGYAYISGGTASPDFPVTSGAYQTTFNNGDAAFVAKLNPTGTAIVWATYLGDQSGNGQSVSEVGPIQLDGNGNIYVTGKVQGGSFPWVGNMEPYSGAPVFVSELDPTGSKLLFSTEFGGGGDGIVSGGLAVDPAGNMYVGFTDPCAGTIVTPGSFQQINHNQGTGCGNYAGTGYVAKISATGTATVVLAASPSPVAAGQTVTLTASVTPTATYASVPTGTIEFQDGGNVLGTVVTLDSTGKATYTSTTLTPGTHSLTAVYSGDNTYPAGNASQSLAVNGLTATVKVTPSPASITTAMSLSVTVAVTGSGATPTGTVTLSGGGYNSSAATLTGGSATIVIPANSLSAGSDTLTVSYSGDANYSQATGTSSVTVTAPATPAITVTPASNSIDAAASLSVTVTVGGSGGVTPTGTVTLTGGGYTSAAAALVNGSVTIVIPANSLALGNDTLTASYSGDSNYSSATGSTPSSSQVTVTPAPIAPTVTVVPASATANTGATLSVPITVTGSGVTPTGTVTLSSGGYTSSAATLVNGSYTFTIPSNSLSAGADTLTAKYSGDSVYLAASATASVTVTQSAYSLAATTPTAVTAGSPATSTVTVSTTTAYAGTVVLACALTASPAAATNLPTCAVTTPSITLGNGSASVTSTVAITSTGATAAMALPVDNSQQNLWKHLGGGAVLAFLVLFGIPSRRRGWRAMLGVLLLFTAIGALSGCGGKSSSNSGKAGTTAGSYTFTVTGIGTPAETPVPTTAFTLTIN
jgi:hypothetical protein